MKNKVAVLLLALLSVALLGGQAYVCHRAGAALPGNVVMAEPEGLGGGQSLKEVEKLTKDGLLLTYKIPRAASAEGIRSTLPVTAIGTNPDYAGVMSHPILDGGFFTEAAYEAKQRHVVLNETAAFGIFGTVRAAGNTLKMEGQTWEVVGVVRDGDKDTARLYLPASVGGGNPEAYLARTEGAQTEAYVRTELTKLGIHEDGYRFVNLAAVGAAFGERLQVSLLSGLAGVLLFLVIRGLRSVAAGYAGFRTALERGYAGEVLAGNRRKLAGFVLLAFVTAAGGILAFALALRILELCLGWRELLKAFGELSSRWFGPVIKETEKWQAVSLILFCTNIISYICLFFGLFRRCSPWYTIHKMEKTAKSRSGAPAVK